jgi:hypothetical protein
MSVRASKPNCALICGFVIADLLLGGCTSTPESQPQPSRPPTLSSSSEPSATANSAPSVPPLPPSLNPDFALTINITILGPKTIPSGEKISVVVGQKVILSVTSDKDDRIHAHTGGKGYVLPVRAGMPAKGSFTIARRGSFEVESHRLRKIIVILNAR